MKRKIIGINIPCFNEQENVVPLTEQLITLFSERLPNYDYIIQFIDNHSTDNTRILLRHLCEKYPNVRAIFNARNFPRTSGYYGIVQAEGDCVIAIPADFQVPLELIPKMIDEWENGAKIVCLIKTSSEESRRMWLVRQLYYWLYKTFSETKVLRGFTGCGLYDRSFLKISRDINDPIISFYQQISELGYNVSTLTYREPLRRDGKSKSNFWVLLDIAINRFTNASSAGPRFATIGGFMLAVMSMLVALAYLVAKLIWWKNFAAGMAPMLIGMFFIGAVQLFFIGLIGEYVLKVNTRLMRFPIVVEEERINFDKTIEKG